METFLAVVVGGLYAAGLYMMMRSNLVKLIIGLALLSHAANLLIFTMGRLIRGMPPLVLADALSPAEPFADPIPQALILTAIVIAFGVQAFAVVLVHGVHQAVGTENLGELKRADKPES
jgi:multicomponent Na+:H+ antiporter subunit C